MLEKDIENLIANYPYEFFPKSDLKLLGQQFNLGKCRADILFKDNFDRYIIVEVKRGILSREASGQIIEYYGRLKEEKPEAIIELILCANVIPIERRSFLEKVGIECKEISIGLILEIAKKYQYKFLDDENTKINLKINKISSGISENKIINNTKVWIFQANPKIYDVLNALSDEKISSEIHWYVGQHKKEIKNGHTGLIWMSGKEAGIYAVTQILSDPDFLNETVEEEKFWLKEYKENKKLLRVKMCAVKKLFNKPLFKSDLKKVVGLENMSILKNAQGTNFPVNNSEWKILSEIINNQESPTVI